MVAHQHFSLALESQDPSAAEELYQGVGAAWPGLADGGLGKSSSRAASMASLSGWVFYHLYLMFASKLMFWFIASDDLITASESSL